MRALIATDFRCYKKGDRLYLNDTTYITVERYKRIFGEIVLCTRIVENFDLTSKYKDATNIIDSLIGIDNLIYALIGKEEKVIKNNINEIDIVIARVPSVIAYKVANIANRYKKPVMALAMGCAWDAYWNHGFVGRMIAPYMYFEMKKVLKNCNYALYVTSEFLQKRYPCSCNINIGCSDVKLKKVEKSVLTNRLNKIKNSKRKDSLTIMTTGDVASYIKGQKYVLEAIKKLKNDGIIINYVLVGEGNQDYLKNIAKRNGIENQVEFTGRLNSEDVMNILDKVDIYIQPSLTEGLSRAVVEAMSRGCPTIVSNAGGNPELIDARCVVKTKSPIDIYEKINYLLQGDNMEYQAKLNFEKAGEFSDEILSKKRNEFFEKLKSDIQKED